MLRVRRACSVQRLIRVLELRAQGRTQPEVADELKMSVRQVRRYEAVIRRGVHLPVEPILQAAWAAYKREESARARARLLAALIEGAAAHAEAEAQQREAEAMLRALEVGAVVPR